MRSLQRSIHLTPVDIAIIAIYFVAVLGIGFYLKSQPARARISSWPGAR